MNFQEQYKAALKDIYYNGLESKDRTGIGTKSVFYKCITHDLSYGFPILTFRKHSLRIALHETHLFLKGSDNIKFLQDANINIWDEHNVNGKIGWAYGKLWRNFGGIDQLEQVLNELKTNPNSRRLIVSAWSPNKWAVLPSCVPMFQFYARNGCLNLNVTARSTDFWNGFGYDFMQYALILKVFANLLDMDARELIFTTTDAHLYLNGMDTYAKAILNYQTLDLPIINIKDLQSLEDPNLLLWNFESVSRYKYAAEYPKVPIAK